MNYGIGGKPRAGKTKRCVLWVDEVLRGQPGKAIVTNMALKMEPWVDGKGKAHKGLLRSLKDKYGETYDAERRVYLMTNEETRQFWRLRPVIPRDEWEPRKLEVVPRSDIWLFDANKYPGCVYIIDEAEVFFPGPSYNQEMYKAEDVQLIQWAKQAGRGGDDALFLTQNLTWLSPRLRSTLQEYRFMTNHVHINFMVFRRPDRITEDTLAHWPMKDKDSILKTTTLFYDREYIEGIYNTAEGVAVTGNSAADIGQRAKGLHWAWMPGAIVGCGLLALLGLLGCKSAVQAAFNRQQSGARSAATQTAHGASGSNAPVTVAVDDLWKAIRRLETGRVSQVTTSVPVLKLRPPELALIGYTKGTAGYACVLTNGQVFMAREVKELGNELLVDGVFYHKARGQDSDKNSLHANR